MPRISLENINDLNPFILEPIPMWGVMWPAYSGRYGYVLSAFSWDPKFGNVLYFGMLNSESQWFIIKELFLPGLVVECYFCKGDSDFWTNWTRRGLLTYKDYPDVE